MNYAMINFRIEKIAFARAERALVRALDIGRCTVRTHNRVKRYIRGYNREGYPSAEYTLRMTKNEGDIAFLVPLAQAYDKAREAFIVADYMLTGCHRDGHITAL